MHIIINPTCRTCDARCMAQVVGECWVTVGMRNDGLPVGMDEDELHHLQPGTTVRAHQLPRAGPPLCGQGLAFLIAHQGNCTFEVTVEKAAPLEY
jgi:hypothetical protein